MVMEHQEYWNKRTEELMLYADRKDIDFFEELQRIYSNHSKEVQKDIFEFFQNYADDNEITLQEAQKKLRGADLSDYQARAKEYFETKDPRLLDRLNEQYRASRVTRLEALKLDTTYRLGTMQGTLEMGFERYLSTLANHSYQKIMGGQSTSTLNEPALKQLIETPFNGYNYSEQLWGNVDDLAKKLFKTFEQGFVKGLGPREMAQDIRKDFNVKRVNAETLVRTDGSMVINNATIKRYVDAGLRYVRVHVHLDDRTSDICREIDRENKKYLIDDVLKNPILPAHFNCRSTYVPDEEELEADI